MVKKIVLAICCFATYTLSAQNGSVSPYSFFGIGDLRSISTVENQMMGGLAMYTDSIHLNINNPASLGKIGPTIYAAAVSHRELRLETFSAEQNTSVTNLDYLAIALPLKVQRMGVNFGLKPFSSVGYNLLDERTNSSGNAVTNRFAGDGGINQLFLSAGFRLLPALHLGATVNYHFGRLENNRQQTTEGVQFGTLDLRESQISGFDFNYALTYEPKISSKHTLFTSARVRTQTNLTSENTQTIGTFVPLSGNEIEVFDVNLDEVNLRFTEIKIPTTYSFGLGVGEDKHWFVGGEYSLQQFSDYSSPFLEASNTRYEDASAIAFGGYFIPDYASFDSYFKRVVYRAGLRLDNSGFIVNDKELSNFGITFGMGLPIGADFTNLNLGFELGRRGTTMNNLVRESYFKVSIGLSLNARWFLKRQIN